MSEWHPLRLRSTRGKVTIILPKSQCTLEAERMMKFAHELMAAAEKALRKAGRIHG